MKGNRKRLLWLVSAILVLAALLFYFIPRRVDSAMHLPAASEDVQSVNLVKYISVLPRSLPSATGNTRWTGRPTRR